MVYGACHGASVPDRSEVDLNGSLWYRQGLDSKRRIQVLKLTSTGHYGIDKQDPEFRLLEF